MAVHDQRLRRAGINRVALVRPCGRLAHGAAHFDFQPRFQRLGVDMHAGFAAGRGQGEHGIDLGRRQGEHPGDAIGRPEQDAHALDRPKDGSPENAKQDHQDRGRNHQARRILR